MVSKKGVGSYAGVYRQSQVACCVVVVVACNRLVYLCIYKHPHIYLYYYYCCGRFFRTMI